MTKITFFFEIAGPFVAIPRPDNVGALRRVLWLWFSFGFIQGTLDDVLNAASQLAQEDATHARPV